MEKKIKWEYATTKVRVDGWQSRFAEYGLAGWELVSVDNGVAYFKRSLEPEKK